MSIDSKAWLRPGSGHTLADVRAGVPTAIGSLIFSPTAPDGWIYCGTVDIVLTVLSTAVVRSQRMAQLTAMKDAVLARAAAEAQALQAQIDAL